jgi:small multidrug resistance pump
MLAWMFMVGAIVFEVAGTTCMKLSDGFHNIVPTVLMVPFYVICFVCLTLAIRKIDISVAYAVWAGVGTTLITVVGILWFDDPATVMKIAAIVLIIGGVVGLNLQMEHEPEKPATEPSEAEEAV